MSSLEHAAKRPRSLSELSGHVRSVAHELAEWGYVFTGFDGKEAAIMTHPQAGVVRIHKSPKSKSGARLSILSLACQQLRHIGVEVELPWRPQQPKKEATTMPVATNDKVRLDARGIRERITALATEGRFGDTFTSSDIYEYLEGKYRLPSWSGDGNRRGYMAISQALTALTKSGRFTRTQEPGEGKRTRYVYSSTLTETPVPDVPLAAAPEPEQAEPEPIDVKVVDRQTGEELPMPPEAEVAPEIPQPEAELADAFQAATAPPGVPAEALEILRGYFVGDMEAENELLREAFTGVVALLAETAATLNAAAQDAAEALLTLGTRPAATKPRRRERHRYGSVAPGRIGAIREERLKKIVDVCDYDQELYFKDVAKATGLSESDAGNALNTAKRHGWRSEEGITVTQPHRGYYVLNSPKGES